MKFSAFVLAIVLAGCANTAKNMDYVSVGMSRSAVIYVLGEPSETRESEEVEYMFYKLRSAPGSEVQAGCGFAGIATFGLAYIIKGCRYSDNDYFVELEKGIVKAYGRIGEFDSTQNPEATIDVNETIKETK